MLIGQAQSWGRNELVRAGIESASIDASLILGYVTNLTRTGLVAHDDETLSPKDADRYVALIKKRQSGYPVAYILGYQEFFGLKLKVTEDTLIPRPDTETLVETALAKCSRGRVLDLGTGSGAVIIALKSQNPSYDCYACDIQEKSLQVARENAQSLGLKVDFRVSNWFSAFAGMKFDLIVSNPPYIEEGDPHLNETSLPFEPQQALTSGKDGLDDIRRIVAAAPLFLKKGGLLLFEHGYNQGKAARQILGDHQFTSVSTIRDLAGQERVSGGCFN